MNYGKSCEVCRAFTYDIFRGSRRRKAFAKIEKAKPGKDGEE
jgi:hypothetical protein